MDCVEDAGIATFQRGPVKRSNKGREYSKPNILGAEYQGTKMTAETLIAKGLDYCERVIKPFDMRCLF